MIKLLYVSGINQYFYVLGFTDINVSFSRTLVANRVEIY